MAKTLKCCGKNFKITDTYRGENIDNYTVLILYTAKCSVCKKTTKYPGGAELVTKTRLVGFIGYDRFVSVGDDETLHYPVHPKDGSINQVFGDEKERYFNMISGRTVTKISKEDDPARSAQKGRPTVSDFTQLIKRPADTVISYVNRLEKLGAL